MFEEMTYEKILSSMMDKVPNEVDKQEGSILYDALAPCAFELAQNYFLLNNYVDAIFLDTAVGDYLERKVADFNLLRKQPTKAIWKMTTDKDVSIGSRWAIEDATYCVIEAIGTGNYKAACEQYGTIGNRYSGAAESLDGLGGVTAKLECILIQGEDAEEDEALRQRAKNKIANSAQDGNVAQYLGWASDYVGVGKAKVFPLWKGGNTVKVSITSSDNTPASLALIEKFQNYLDPKQSGLGEGKAPLGAKVTVTTGSKKMIDISADIVLEEGYSNADEASAKIEEYLRKITYRQAYVGYFFIGNILVGLDSIYDMRNLKLNGTTGDIPLGEEEIPTLGSINLRVVT